MFPCLPGAPPSLCARRTETHFAFTRLTFTINRRWVLILFAILSCGGVCRLTFAQSAQSHRLWTRDNLVAWEAAPLDVAQRTPDQRAQMLQRLGIKRYAYLSSTNPWDIPNDINTSHFDVDAEIKAMLKHGINIQAWYFWLNSDAPATDPKLEAFKRYNIRPQLWISQSHKDYPREIGDLADQISRYLNTDVTVPRTWEEYENLPEPQKKQVGSAWMQAWNEFHAADFPKTAEDQRKRIEREAARIEALVKLSEPYGCQVNLYNHGSSARDSGTTQATQSDQGWARL